MTMSAIHNIAAKRLDGSEQSLENVVEREIVA